MAGIQILGVTKRFGSVLVVDEVSLEIRDKEFVTLLGPSGCGKTTTLRMLAGFLKPDAGEIYVDGQLLSSPKYVVPPEKRHMGMVFQNYAIWPHMSVFENVAFGLRVKKLPERIVKDKVNWILQVMGLEDLSNRYPGQLSGGQQQRVALARSLVVEPTILLLDEPLSNLDAKLRERMRMELKDLQRRMGITFVYVTHDQAEAMALSDRVAVLCRGRLQQYAPPRLVYERPSNKMVADFMGLVNLLYGTVETLPVGDAGVGRVRLRAGSGAAGSAGQGPSIEATLPGDLACGQKVVVIVRPEDVALSRQRGDDANSFPARVSSHTYLGSLVDYRVEMAGLSLRVQAPRGDIVDAGQTCYVRLVPSRCIVMAEEEGPGDAYGEACEVVAGAQQP